ncbi:antitoxin Xre/MbcA/ParS toxin-binding domain-containing protein [Glaciecola sp. MF2-115]|uniref:antitoxin Xre/MbcA/ParS toxin-binding domain-containing protein n=1 Tax=Glaciecola sp. MF2-115 TaxID=3384827 RepID=UPI0039A0FBB4
MFNTTQKQILRGVNVAKVDVLAKRFSVSIEEMANILGVSPRVLQKKSAGKTHILDKNLSERCINLDNLFNLAVNYFGSENSASLWFRNENIGLGSVTPFSLCETFFGMQCVENTIIKLTYGMTA